MNYYYQNPNQFFSPQQSLNCKMVDSVDVVKVLEVPIGGYGIFPKADFSEVYVKTWNPNGTTSIVTYKPDSEPIKTPENILLDRINELEKKIDAAIGSRQSESRPPQKEVKRNDY